VEPISAARGCSKQPTAPRNRKSPNSGYQLFSSFQVQNGTSAPAGEAINFAPWRAATGIAKCLFSRAYESVIPKSVPRLLEKIMRQQKAGAG
jgi:hypothetical protein